VVHILKTIDDYKNTLNEVQLKWLVDVEDFLLKKYSEYPYNLSYQRPMIKINKQIFIMFGGGKNHFSIYSTDFDYVNKVKLEKIKGLKFGKSAILFPLDKLEYLSFVYKFIDDIIERNKESHHQDY
jgi:uncharacterized protein YdhG (YjbR/CyaY superfamily)